MFAAATSSTRPRPAPGRRLHVAVFSLLLLTVASCGGGGATPKSESVTSGVTSSPATTSLPLQSMGLAIGGDVQSRATDVVRVAITPQQLAEISRLCDRVVEVAPDDCGNRIKDVFSAAMAEAKAASRAPDAKQADCPPKAICMALKLLSSTPSAGASTPTPAQRYFVVITDDRPGESLCAAEPTHTCLRVGAKSTDVFLAGTARSSPPSVKPSTSASPSSPVASTRSQTPTAAVSSSRPGTATSSNSASAKPSAAATRSP